MTKERLRPSEDIMDGKTYTLSYYRGTGSDYVYAEAADGSVNLRADAEDRPAYQSPLEYIKQLYGREDFENWDFNDGIVGEDEDWVATTDGETDEIAEYLMEEMLRPSEGIMAGKTHTLSYYRGTGSDYVYAEAAAEYFNRNVLNDELIAALLTIKKECSERSGCRSCPLRLEDDNNEGPSCYLSVTVPSQWNIDKNEMELI